MPGAVPGAVPRVVRRATASSAHAGGGPEDPSRRAVKAGAATPGFLQLARRFCCHTCCVGRHSYTHKPCAACPCPRTAPQHLFPAVPSTPLSSSSQSLTATLPSLRPSRRRRRRRLSPRTAVFQPAPPLLDDNRAHQNNAISPGTLGVAQAYAHGHTAPALPLLFVRYFSSRCLRPRPGSERGRGDPSTIAFRKDAPLPTRGGREVPTLESRPTLTVVRASPHPGSYTPSCPSPSRPAAVPINLLPPALPHSFIPYLPDLTLASFSPISHPVMRPLTKLYHTE